MFVVALKLNGKVNPCCYGGYTYMKTRPVEKCEDLEDGRLSTPVKGHGYWCCNLFTSDVVSFRRYGGGWEVQTRNSLYRFFIADEETVKSMAKENGFTGPRGIDDESDSMYWSQDFS